jgi:hypothetical protein
MAFRGVCYDRAMFPRAARLILVLATLVPCPVYAGAAGRGADPLLQARRLYNQGQLDAAMTAAQQAAANPSVASSARLVIGRIHLERYRLSTEPGDLESARGELRAVDARALDPRERIELQVGLAALLYFEEHYGAAAELLDPIVDASGTLAPDAHDRALDWWATALDRQAQASTDRYAAYVRITERMEQELRRDSSSLPANYWLAAAARASGDLDRAMAAASAGWIRATLSGERGAPLRADLDRLVMEAIIPDRAARLPQRDRRQATTTMTSDWEEFKKIW